MKAGAWVWGREPTELPCEGLRPCSGPGRWEGQEASSGGWEISGGGRLP